MSSAQWVAAVVFLPATAFVWLRMRPMIDLVSGETPGRRTRRLIVRRAFLAMGLWEWSVGLFLVASGSVGTSVALFGVGVGMLLAARFPEAIGL